MEIKEFTVHDRLGPVQVTGALLVDQRFGSDRKPRWTDMALYKIVESGDYWQVTLRCGGCTPARVLDVGSTELTGAPIVCGSCSKPFIPDAVQSRKQFQYALEIIARSFVYHRFGGPCVRKKHKITTVGEAKESAGRWRNLYPCWKPGCKPPDLENMRDEDRIAEERQDTHVYLCSDASAIVARLYRHSGEISEMAAKMLRDAARKDPDIASAWQEPRRV